MTNRQQRRNGAEYLARENLKYPDTLVEIPRHEWLGVVPSGLVRVWRSRWFLVQIYEERDGVMRLSVSRTALKGARWADGIAWEVLQRVKRECGFGDYDALEVYPADCDIVDVANMRHLWVLPQPLPFVWRRMSQ